MTAKQLPTASLSASDYGKLKRIAVETALHLQPHESPARIRKIVAMAEAELRRINSMIPEMDKSINDEMLKTTHHSSEI